LANNQSALAEVAEKKAKAEAKEKRVAELAAADNEAQQFETDLAKLEADVAAKQMELSEASQAEN